MRRIKLTVAYDGTDYCGWQIQPNGITVEEVLNKALSDLTKETVKVIGASRTDAGVEKTGGGNILNISSMSAIRGIPDPVNNNGIYTATKFAINGFTECMQKYLLKYGIRVTALCPGSTATSWWTRWTHSFGTDAMLPVDTLADIVELIVMSPEKVLFKQLQVLPTVEIDNF